MPISTDAGDVPLSWLPGPGSRRCPSARRPPRPSLPRDRGFCVTARCAPDGSSHRWPGACHGLTDLGETAGEGREVHSLGIYLSLGLLLPQGRVAESATVLERRPEIGVGGQRDRELIGPPHPGTSATRRRRRPAAPAAAQRGRDAGAGAFQGSAAPRQLPVAVGIEDQPVGRARRSARPRSGAGRGRRGGVRAARSWTRSLGPAARRNLRAPRRRARPWRPRRSAAGRDSAG